MMIVPFLNKGPLETLILVLEPVIRLIGFVIQALIDLLFIPMVEAITNTNAFWVAFFTWYGPGALSVLLQCALIILLYRRNGRVF